MFLATPPHSIPALKDTERGIPVIELPMEPTRDIAAEYRAIEHGHPVVNGWGGYDPPHYVVLRSALRSDDGPVLAELSHGRPLLVVVDHREQFDRWSALVTSQHGQQIADDGEHRVYRLQAEPAPVVTRGGAPLAIQSVVANVGGDRISRLLDGDPQTEWNSEQVQLGGEELVVDLGQERRVAGVRLDLGGFFSDYPRRLTIECSGDAGRWETCWQGSAGAIALRAVLADPLNARMSIPIARDGVRRLRLRQTGVDMLNGWSIAELTVLGH
jgi:hypothetical protein